LTVIAPATASGDFTVTVQLDGVTDPYTGFNASLTFDPSIISSGGAAGGTTLTNDPNQEFCTSTPSPPAGSAVVACTLLGSTTSTSNGALATFTFHRVGAGTAQIHLRTFAEGGAVDGTYIVVNKDNGDGTASPTPLEVGLNDATVTVS
jgi:hypothetical protein